MHVLVQGSYKIMNNNENILSGRRALEEGNIEYKMKTNSIA